jgi:hypothetical protein
MLIASGPNPSSHATCHTVCTCWAGEQQWCGCAPMDLLQHSLMLLVAAIFGQCNSYTISWAWSRIGT